MRTITLACTAIVLFSALASARLGDSADIPAAVTDPVTAPTPVTAASPATAAAPDTAAIPLTATAPVTAAAPSSASNAPSSADVLNFLSGVWDSIGLGHEFDDFSSCIKGTNNAGAQLQKLMTLLDSSSATEVSSGLSLVDNVINPMITGIKTCNMKDKYTTTVTQIVAQFANPSKMFVQISVSISLNDVEVYPDITAAIAACNTGDYSTCGSSIGGAMGKVFYGQGNATSSDQAAKLNSLPDMTWTAANSPVFNGLNLWQFKKNRITLRRRNNNDSSSASGDDGRRNLATVPAAFDSRTNWPNCIHAIRDQGNCGSCWAFAASEVLSDRFCIVSNKSINTVMSPQYLVSCDTSDAGCNGGYPLYSWRFLEKSGDLSDSCAPYKSGNGFAPSCSTFSRCSDGSTLRRYYAKTNSSKYFTTPSAIQAEVYANGPVEASMDVYSDFMYYSSGIYSTTKGASYLGGHAVKIVGWGSSNGTNYWIVANSWGTYWGESGYFRIKFGSSSIDSGCIAGLPDLTRQ